MKIPRETVEAAYAIGEWALYPKWFAVRDPLKVVSKFARFKEPTVIFAANEDTAGIIAFKNWDNDTLAKLEENRDAPAIWYIVYPHRSYPAWINLEYAIADVGERYGWWDSERARLYRNTAYRYGYWLESLRQVTNYDLAWSVLRKGCS